MKSNWIEIKRFLNDYKKIIMIGSIIISILFSLIVYTLDLYKEEHTEEEYDDSELSSSEILNDARPAYFKIYIVKDDGKEFTNSSIINEYFNLDSVKQKVKEETGIDIKKVEETGTLYDLDEEIEVVKVRRNDSSYLITASFNLGNERKNLIIADYYYELLNNNDLPMLEDKSIYIFKKPGLVSLTEEDSNLEDSDNESEALNESSKTKIIIGYIKNIFIGFILGVVAMIGTALLKVVFSKTLNYSFTYEVSEDDKFILADKKLDNKDLVMQFIAYPLKNKKIILSEKDINKSIRKVLINNGEFTFNKNMKDKKLLTNIQSFSELKLGINISEMIIIIYPGLTTRKWYEKQKEFAAINKVPVKIIQIND